MIRINDLNKRQEDKICFLKKAGIYYFKCLVSNKGYVGQSNNINRRIREHLCHLRENRHSNVHWQNSWNKYGEENYTWEVLEYCSVEELNERETYWIKELNTLSPNGFNHTCGGDCQHEISDDLRSKFQECWTIERRNKQKIISKSLMDSLTEEERIERGKKISNAFTDDRKERMRDFKKQFWENIPEEKRLEMSQKQSQNHHDVSGGNNPRAKKVICLETNEIFATMKEAAKYYGMNYTTIKNHMRGVAKSAKGYHFEFLAS